MAAELLREHRDAPFDETLNIAFRKAVSRDAMERERSSLLELYQKQLEYFTAHPEDAKQFVSVGNKRVAADAEISNLAAWSQVCRVILNLHETITRY